MRTYGDESVSVMRTYGDDNEDDIVHDDIRYKRIGDADVYLWKDIC